MTQSESKKQSSEPDTFAALEEFPNLKEPFVAAFRKFRLKKNTVTLSSCLNNLDSGFLRFLRESKFQACSLLQISSVQHEFVAWLNQCKTEEGKPFTKNYRARLLDTVWQILWILRNDEVYKADAARVRAEFPRNQWPGRSRTGVPTPRLSRDHLRCILEAAEREVLEAEARIEVRNNAIATYGPLIDKPKFAQYALEPKEIFIAVFDRCFPLGLLPHRPTLKSLNCTASNAMERRKFGYQRILPYFVATARALVPFIVLTNIATAFNPTTVLELKWSRINFGTRFEMPVVRIGGVKRRASGDPVITLDATPSEHFGFERMFRVLREYTERLRPHVKDPMHRDLVFICVQSQPKRYLPPAGFAGTRGPTNDIKLTRALEGFCRDNKLESFSLRQLRVTVLDEVQLQTGDIRASKELGQQKRVDTLWKHYTSDGTRRRDHERLGECFLLRERWWQTDGKIDPRARTGAMDCGAATPGFLCFDPFDSPRAGQRKGSLCSAYGECPSCPHAAACVSDPAAVAFYLALKNSIFAARDLMAPQAWLGRWAPIATDLELLITKIPTSIKQRANQLAITLPTVG